MGYAPKQRPVKRINLVSQPEFWVDIFSTIKYREKMALGLINEEDAHRRVIASSDKLLRVMISAWNLTDEDGNLLPINDDTIDILETNDADKILDALGDIIVIEFAKIEENEQEKKESPRT